MTDDGSSQYILLRDAFERWSESKHASSFFVDEPRLVTRAGRKFFDYGHDQLYPANFIEEFGIKRLERVMLADVFGRCLRIDGIALVVSTTPDSATKKTLDIGVWPEGPHCWPLALYSRIRNHRLKDFRPSEDRPELALYDGHLVFLNKTVFEEWLNKKTRENSLNSRPTASSELAISDRILVGVRLPKTGEKESPELLEVMKWFKHREKTWPSGKALPGETEDIQAVREAFPNFHIARATFRHVRKQATGYEWTKPGRRRHQASKKKEG